MKIGIIGCGHWGKNYVRVLHELKGASVIACCDALKANIDNIKERYPKTLFTTDANDILKSKDIEAVVVATPASSHHALAMEALKNGKHLIVEKPLALTVKECEEMIAAAKKAKKTLMVGHTFLYNDSVRKMRELIEAGSVGDVYYITAKRNHMGLIREDVAALWDLAPHDIAICSYLLGAAPKAVSAVGGEYLRAGRCDVAFITLFFERNVMANIQVSWVDSNKVREVAVIGSKERIVFDDLNPMESIRIYQKGISFDKDVDSFGEFQYLLRDGDIVSPKINHREPLKVQCQHFLDSLSSGNTPLSDGINGLNVVKALIAATESIRKKGALIEIG